LPADVVRLEIRGFGTETDSGGQVAKPTKGEVMHKKMHGKMKNINGAPS